MTNLLIYLLIFILGFEVRLAFLEVNSLTLTVGLTITISSLMFLVASISSSRRTEHYDLIYSMDSGVVMFDRQGKIVTVNPAVKRLVGGLDIFSIEDLSNLFKTGSLKQNKGNIDLHQWINEAVGLGKVIHIEKMQLGEKTLEVFVTPVHDQSNRVVSGAIILHDITYLTQAEKVQSEFLSVAAHQLRAPLGSMRWNMEMLLGGDVGEVSESVKKSLMSIYLGIQRMIREVNDLLIVTRIDQRRVQDKPVVVDVINMIQDVAKEMDYVKETNSVSINLHYNPGFRPQVVVDSQRFRDVLQNVINNSVKYNHPGGRVDISISEENGQIRIDIQDTGIGIPLHEQNHIFSKFFRANNAIKTKSEGSGLGLFVARSYMEAWGGKVWFESTEDKGTVFHLLLPPETVTHSLDQNLEDHSLQLPT